MGAKPSKAVKKAFGYFIGGSITVAEAAKKAGIDQSTLRRYPEYKAFIKRINPARGSENG